MELGKKFKRHKIPEPIIGGTFSATIPGDQVTGESITYNFETSDYGGNVVATEEYTVEVKPGNRYRVLRRF